MSGTVDILNCKLGDLKLSFDKDNPVEAERACRAVKKMLRDGFVIFVEVDGKLTRVLDFDETKSEYLISDVPAESAAQPQTAAHPAAAEEPTTEPTDVARKPGKRGRRGVAAGKHRATAVAPRAGG